MEREHANAITSLGRLPDWKYLMDYIARAVRELEYNLGYMDSTDSHAISRVQGARSALMNLLDVEEKALEVLSPEEDND